LAEHRDLPAADVAGDPFTGAMLCVVHSYGQAFSGPHHAHSSHHQIRQHVAPAPIKAPPDQLHHQHLPTSNLFGLHGPKHSRQSSKS
jgi:hypothetical protein